MTRTSRIRLIPPPALRYLLVSRLVAFVIIFGVVIVLLHARAILLGPLVAYASLSLAYLYYIISHRQRPFDQVFLWLVGAQLGLEVLVTAGVVHFTGGAVSSYPILFVFTIVSASLVYHLAGTLVTASAASFVFAGVVWIGTNFRQALPPGLRIEPSATSGEELFATVFLYVCFFFLIAFVSGFLAERARESSVEADIAVGELKRSRLDTDSILQSIGSGILTVGSDGSVLYVNREAERLLGYASEEVRGKTFVDALSRSSSEIADVIKMGLSGEATRSIEISLSRGDVDVPVSLSTVVFSDGNEVRGVVATLSDLSDAKAMEERIRESDRLAAIGELSAGIAHEIRNPLASISGSVQILADEMEVSDEHERLMRLITRETDRLNTILTEFLQFTSIRPQSRERVDLSRVVSEVLGLLRRSPAYRSGMTIHNALAEGPLFVAGEESQIKSVVYNLAINAVEAMGDREEKELRLLSARLVDVWPDVEGRFVSVAGEEEVRELVPLAVVDTGDGIDEQMRERIFQPFFSTKRRGTGLGLPTVRRLVEALSGRIEFASEPDRGTAFVVYFPAYQKILLT
jgi:two-component system sensor histidine kinase PilS (NtrC family)